MKTQTTIMMLGVIAAASLISVAAFSENATQYSVVSTQAFQGIQMVGHLEMVGSHQASERARGAGSQVRDGLREPVLPPRLLPEGWERTLGR